MYTTLHVHRILLILSVMFHLNILSFSVIKGRFNRHLYYRFLSPSFRFDPGLFCTYQSLL